MAENNAVRKFAEKSVAQTKETMEKMSAASEEATQVFRNYYSEAMEAMIAYNTKVLELAAVDAKFAFDFAQEMSSVRSPSELIEVMTKHSNEQVKLLTAQAKELSTLAQKHFLKIRENVVSS